MLEGKFKTEVVKDLEELFPGCIILYNDPHYIQGFPDITILYKNMWACLEGKKSLKEPYQPNQKYYLDVLDDMSFASMICPENKEAVLYELQLAFKTDRATRFSRC
jgi:hypothetical protein